MWTPPSLRVSLIAGLVVLQSVVLAGVSFSVYERSRSIAEGAVRSDLELRARTLAGSLEIDGGKTEMELEPSAAPEYFTEGVAPFMFIRNVSGAMPPVRSPSIGAESLLPTARWEAGAMVHEDVADGPFGIPCAMVTHSFLVRIDGVDAGDDDDDDDGWSGLTDEERRYQVKVAVDSRERDRPIVALAWFLVLIDCAALAVTLAGGWLLARIVLRPVGYMTEEARLLSATDPERRLVPSAIVEELRLLAVTLNGAFDRLTGALDRQRRFTADAGHELRTPVSILLSNADLLLRRERSKDEYIEGLQLQRRTGRRMQALVEDLLYLARGDSSAADLQFADHDIALLVDSVASEFAPLAAAEGVTLATSHQAGLTVRCDERAFSRVLRNLISNALKFTPSAGTVRVVVELENARAVVAVEDSGPGIPAPDRDDVFERFFRVQEGRDPKEGTGLGLAIARSIVVAHAGTIHVEDAPHGGARFVVKLPGGRASRTPAPERQRARSTATRSR